jgi:hypothetical protein
MFLKKRALSLTEQKDLQSKDLTLGTQEVDDSRPGR